MKIIAHSSHPGLPDRITIDVGGEVFTLESTPSPVPVDGWHAPYIGDEHRNAIEAPMISAARCWRGGTILSLAADLGFAYELERRGERDGFRHPATPRNGVWVSMATLIETGLPIA